MNYPVDANGRPRHTHFLDRGNRRFLQTTNHAWRKKKRAQLRTLEKAAWEYLTGSAYTPFSGLQAPKTPMGLLDLIRHMRKQLSTENWGR